ncbi:ABC1 kinase family protein [Alteribacter natronophilus]|uniref:ABC1 kinase family protein n=1 Tax=Alteribacter natronophilus TaxID=2583810 RepID=UPI00110E125C|nr:AarF/UbiB family protein [Alteribacter natronophilus]TMW70754.1 AarF/ABC1/UbiB kinase family protein [Alteribacter natronophilus]
MKLKSRPKRMGKVLGLAISIFIQIYWYKWTRKSEAQWTVLWENSGKKVRDTLFELEGLLIKAGQFLSIRADLLPGPFIAQIRDLTDQVPSSEWAAVKNVLEREWGCSVENRLQQVEKKAVASASIGEVYKGLLKNGDEVAVKVRRPGIDSVVETDFRILRILMWMAARFAPVPKGFIDFPLLYGELRQVIEQELDLTSEKETLLSFRERFRESGDVIIPDVHEELCTDQVIVMEWLDGVKLSDAHALAEAGIESDDLAGRLLDVFLPQWLEPGLFHADPHGGNVLVSESGKIILLDFGMYGEISERDAEAFQSLIGALLAKDYKKAALSLRELGFLQKDANSSVIEDVLAELMSFKPAELKGKDLLAIKLELNRRIQSLPIQVPARFIFLGRSFITIEGTIRSLVPEEELMGLMKPAFINWINSHGNRKWFFLWEWIQSHPFFSPLHLITGFLKTPEKLQLIKENEQRRHFHFTLYENRKKQWFQLFLLSLAGSGAGLYGEHTLLMQISIATAAASGAGLLYTGAKLREWMNRWPNHPG